ncbi:MAG: hypothetical protein JJU46_09415 [Balneolaceae bacterium]|nr:hypothetical protein [Balneolaceae bacterium]MCH8549020.1 hypothetical protein [Balneolaceae bacterium]
MRQTSTNEVLIKRSTYSIFLLLLVLSCSKVDDTNQTNFEAVKQLHPTTINVSGTELLVPSGLDVLESGLLIIERGQYTNKFKFFDFDQYQLIGAFGTSGRGPDEYSESIPQPVSTTITDNVQLYDWVKKRIQVYDISVNDHDEEVIQTKINEYVLPPELMLSQYSAFINDSTVVSSGGLSGGYISFTNVTTDQTDYFNPLDYDLSDYGHREKSYLFESLFAVNNEKKLIAVASKYMPELHIVTFEGDIVAKTNLPIDVDLTKLTDIENMTVNFYGVTSSSQYIYASYVGKSMNEMSVILDSTEFQDIDLIQLYKFDWDGNFIDSFILTGGLYRYLSIDEANRRLYSINTISPNYEVVYFEME